MISQVSAGRKNQLWFELTGTEAAVGFDQEQPETLWVGRRAGAERIPRDFDTLSRRGGRLRDAARRTPAGLSRLLRRVRRRDLRGDRAATAPPTGCRRSPTACAPAGSPRRARVGARAARAGSRWRHEARACSPPACPSARSTRSPPGPARTASRRSSWPPGRGSATGRSSPRHIAADGFDEAEAERVRRDARRQRARALGARLLRQQPAPRSRRSARRSTTTCAPASTPPRRSAASRSGTFIGRDNSLSVADNLREAERVFAAARRLRRRARRAS